MVLNFEPKWPRGLGWWRGGESNPGPPSSSCRILRAQPPVGCRPVRSRQLSPIGPSGMGLGPAVPESRRGHPASATPLADGAGTHQTGRATYLSGSQRHLWFGTCFCLPGCFARFRKPRLASDTAITQRRIQVTPMSSRYRPLYKPPATAAPRFFVPDRARSPRGVGPPGGFPSLSPGAARVHGSPVACPPCCVPWRAPPPAWPSRP